MMAHQHALVEKEISTQLAEDLSWKTQWFFNDESTSSGSWHHTLVTNAHCI